MRVLDLFSGIGGFSLGLERAGMRTVAFCEIDPYARAVLARHWPGVPIHDDVRTLRAEHVGPVEVIAGGFPCQDISLAGKGAGIDGERSGLWREMARVIGECRPRWVIAENVPALRTRGADRVLGDLEAVGYACWPLVVGAVHAGAPHRRQRVWIVAHTECCELRQQPGRSSRPAGEDAALAGDDGEVRPLADAARDGWQSRGPRDAAQGPRGRQSEGSGVRSNVPDADEPRLEERRARSHADEFAAAKRADWWIVEPDVGGAFDGFPRWLHRHVGQGLSHAESRRRAEVLRSVWCPDIAKALWRAAGGLERVQAAEVLFAFVREYEGPSDEARLLVAGAQASEALLRSLRERAILGGAPRQSERRGQPTGEHSNALLAVSRLLALDSAPNWASGGWEDGVPRTAGRIHRRVDRLRCLGNSVVPQVVEAIGRAIMSADGPDG